jgi:hypothetical protein
MRQAALQIKKEIKAKLGIAPSRYSLKWEPCTYSRSLECRITDPTLGTDDLKNFLSSFESCRYCEVSGEPLLGGNTYISVYYKWDLLTERYRDLLRSELQTEFLDFLNSPLNKWGPSCWNPFCPTDLYDAFITEAAKKPRAISDTESVIVHKDFLSTFFGSPHRCDKLLNTFFQQKAA